MQIHAEEMISMYWYSKEIGRKFWKNHKHTDIMRHKRKKKKFL